MNELPHTIDSGLWDTGHCQGIALDLKRGFVYYSFTTALVKTDLEGHLLGTVTGLLGHLGCIAFCEEDGCVYGSLEYKNDAIGKGILGRLGHAKVEDAFYIAVFDGPKIDRLGMDGAADGVMRAAYLSEVVDDYNAEVSLPDGRTVKHRFGCSGIDGTSIGPVFGAPADSQRFLFTCYGVYSDLSRTDNDYQVLLQYSLEELRRTAKPLCQEAMHHSGPALLGKYFIYTGNTTYGVQNLEYDPYSGRWLMAVYRGKKEGFPNNPMYAIDASVAPSRQSLAGHPVGTVGDVLALAQGSLTDPVTGISGYPYGHGSTGLFSIGDGRYYVSYDEKADGKYRTTVRLCRWNGKDPLEIAE